MAVRTGARREIGFDTLVLGWGEGGELEPYLGGGGEFERTHAHPHMPALVMVLKYVKLVTGDLSARFPSLPIRKPLPDSLYCW